jgi:hypothetical protein
MMFKKKLLASAMATAMVAGAMVSGSAQAVRISESGAGQVLMGSLYTVDKGFSTNLTVVNSNTTNAVKARIVLRSMKNSEECRDLVLYLTPGDVWRGVVKLVNGQPTLTSTDDSVIASYDVTGLVPTFATEAKPYSNALATLSSGDSCLVGHIEVVGVYTATGGVTTYDPVTFEKGSVVNVKRGMSKTDLYKIFMSPRAAIVGGVSTPLLNTNGIAKIASTDPTRMQLSGVAEIVSPTDRALYPMLALREGSNPGTGGTDTLVIGNEAWDFVQGATLPLGVNMGFGGADNIVDIEYALAVGGLSSSYEHDGTAAGKNTNIALTYPTKYRHLGTAALAGVLSATGAAVPGATGCVASANTLTYSSPFASNGAVKYGIESYDNSEGGAVCFQSPCGANSWTTDEVNYIGINDLAGRLKMPAAPAGIYYGTQGWFRVNLEAVAGCSYAGVPAIGYSHRFVSDGVNSSMSVFEPMTRPYMAP